MLYKSCVSQENFHGMLGCQVLSRPRLIRLSTSRSPDADHDRSQTSVFDLGGAVGLPFAVKQCIID
jgi:hypothetical protein